MKQTVFCLLCLCAAPVVADPPVIIGARLVPAGIGWTASVTLAHPDTGWEHYTDGWQIESADGTVLGTRTLLHPHVTEQPFTRGLSGIVIPQGTPRVYIRARCQRDGWNSDAVGYDLISGTLVSPQD